jgi:glutamyl-tRNA synthetase
MGALRRRHTPAELIGRLAFLAGLTDNPAPARAAELIGAFSWEKVKREDIALPDGLF